MARRYKASPIGVLNHVWVNVPDTKFIADGLYHTELILEGDEAQAFKDEIDTLVAEAFEAETQDMKGPEKKKWGIHAPYEVEEDPENGEPTGRIVFKFKQNAKIRQPDGAMKAYVMGLRDSNDKPLDPKTDKVFAGSTGRVMWAGRNTKLASAQKIGLRLDFSMVQIAKLSEGRGGGFGTIEGGYTKGDEDGNDAGAKDDAY